MHLRRSESNVEVTAPAKINLFLEVLAKRPDGFHEIETVIATVTLYDTLIFSPVEESAIILECRSASPAVANEIPRGPENLVWRAAELVRRTAGITGGAKICLVKRIPAAAGLGGASSDAAATLVAANQAWKLHWPRERLAELAGKLGSDVPFFLTRGAAICRGRGEQIESIAPTRLHLVIARPPVGLATSAVYSICRPASAPQTSARLLNALKRGNVAAVGHALANGLQQAATSLTPWIDRLLDEFARMDVTGQQMSGSGSSCFAICRSARHARRTAARLGARNVGAVVAAATSVAG